MINLLHILMISCHISPIQLYIIEYPLFVWPFLVFLVSIPAEISQEGQVVGIFQDNQIDLSTDPTALEVVISEETIRPVKKQRKDETLGKWCQENDFTGFSQLVGFGTLSLDKIFDMHTDELC